MFLYDTMALEYRQTHKLRQDCTFTATGSVIVVRQHQRIEHTSLQHGIRPAGISIACWGIALFIRSEQPQEISAVPKHSVLLIKRRIKKEEKWGRGTETNKHKRHFPKYILPID